MPKVFLSSFPEYPVGIGTISQIGVVAGRHRACPSASLDKSENLYY